MWQRGVTAVLPASVCSSTSFFFSLSFVFSCSLGNGVTQLRLEFGDRQPLSLVLEALARHLAVAQVLPLGLGLPLRQLERSAI